MAKAPKWQNPKFAADPILFMVREGLSELKHLEQALRSYETQSANGKVVDRNLFAQMALRMNLGGWVASLNETCIALTYLSRYPGDTGAAQVLQVNYLKSQLDQADLVWGGALRRAMEIIGKGMAAKAKRDAAQRARLIKAATPIVKEIKKLKELAEAWLD